MDSNMLRGHTENFVLSLLKNKDMYGYEMLEGIAKKTNGKFAIKKITLYKTLERLEKAEYIVSYYDQDGESKGGKRKYFRITDEGRKKIKEDIYKWKETKEILEQFIIESSHVTIGDNVLYYDEVTSTNDLAKEFAQKKITEGSCIVADTQKKGRGRLNRNWYDQKGKAIAMSIVLYPKTDLKDLTKITQVAAAGVYETLKQYGVLAKIKWPNDILIKGKKLCGILVESALKAKEVEYVVIGIGLNLNLDMEVVPEDLKLTSLNVETGREVDKDEFILNLLNNLTIYYNQFLKGGNVFTDICRENSYLIGKEAFIKVDGKSYKVEILDISTNGELLVRNEYGQIESYVQTEVTLEDNY